MSKGIKSNELWKRNWKYQESFVIGFGLLILGFIIEYLTGGKGYSIPGWPVNLYILIAFINLLVALHILYRDSKIVRWIGSVPAAISSIVIFTFLILLMGFTHQNDKEVPEIIRLIGISHTTRSWAYLFISVYFLFTLGMVSLRKMWPLTKKNVGFLLNHAGLWIIIAAGSLGSSDLLRLKMNLYENEISWYAFDDYRRQYEMPMAITLLDFNIDEYNPKIGLFDNKSGLMVDVEGLNMFQIEKGFEIDILNYSFKVKDFFPTAEKSGDQYVEIDNFGAGPAALIEVTTTDNIVSEQWVTSGNFMYSPKLFKLNDLHTLYMFEPEPKKYSSDVVLEDKNGNRDTITLEVNKPIKSHGWKIYQLSYDEKLGKYSRSSVIELVSDPWLIFVYLGIFMVLAGSIYIFWVGRKVKE